jgi:tRNA threonylcarbamoyladenosine dehydratase
MNLNRLESLLGIPNVEKIRNLNILILGLGGVGGYVVESLTRCGINKITLVDSDIIKPSNINRQIIATRRTMNHYKTKEWKKRIKIINKDALVNIINVKINENNIETLFSEKYNYIIDACDTTIVKVKLIEECHKRGIKLVSCMGTANKIDATKIELTTLDKTDYDPLAKKIRKELKNKDIMKNVVVISSNEKAINPGVLGSTSYVPAVAGLYVTNYIINDVIKDKVI